MLDVKRFCCVITDRVSCWYFIGILLEEIILKLLYFIFKTVGMSCVALCAGVWEGAGADGHAGPRGASRR